MSKPVYSSSGESRRSGVMTVRTLASCAFLTALSVVLARLIVPMPNETTRFSIEAIPIFLAGMLFGPLAGGMVGFSADFIGCMFSAFGYNPVFSIPPILYGVVAGLFRPMLANRLTLPRMLLAWIIPVVFGSILYQSVAFAFFYSKDEAFSAYLSAKLIERSIQFSITYVLDVVLTWLLFQARVFERAKVWPPKQKQQ